MSQLCLDVQQSVILSTLSSHKYLQSPVTMQKQTFLTKAAVALVYRHKHCNLEGKLTGTPCTFSKQEDLCASHPWPGYSTRCEFLPSCGIGIKFKRKTVGYLYNRFAIIALVSTSCLVSRLSLTFQVVLFNIHQNLREQKY